MCKNRSSHVQIEQVKKTHSRQIWVKTLIGILIFDEQKITAAKALEAE
jgi:hypothetical protein